MASAVLRWSLLAGCVLLLAAAAVLLALGADALQADGSREVLLVGVVLPRGVAVLLTVAGCLLLLLALLGAAGTLLASRALLLICSCFGGLLLLLTLLAAVAALLITGPMAAHVQTRMMASLALYGEDKHVTRLWDLLQSGFHCCGVTNGGDWQRNSTLSTAVPSSCCVRYGNGTAAACETAPTSANSYWRTGCVANARRLLLRRGWTIGGATIALTVLLLGGMVAGCCAARRRKRLEATHFSQTGYLRN